MRSRIKIIGFYIRKRDASEFVLYEENGKFRLTNGKLVWRDFVEKKYLPQLIKVDKIDLKEMIDRIKGHKPYSEKTKEEIVKELNEYKM